MVAQCLALKSLLYTFMNETKTKGLITELQCQTYFLKEGYMISTPIGENCRYDLIVDIDNQLYRIQVKTCQEVENGISFSTRSSYMTASGTVSKKYTSNEIDFFATYYKDNCYLIPVTQVGKTQKKLLFDGMKQTNGCAYLRDYLATDIIQRIKEGREMPNEKMVVSQYDLNDNFIQSFPTLMAAAKSLGKDQCSHISACIRGQRATAYNFKWKYTKKEE